MTGAVDPAAILAALECDRPGCECHRSLRRGQGKTHCPCHADGSPSLNVSVARDGTILVKCHGGCRNRDVIRALQDRGLWPQPEHRRNHQTRYELRDTDGTLIAVHVRLDTPDGKRMWWESPDGRKGLDGRRVEDLPLYGVHRLGDAAEVIVCEGEKAADALQRLGLSAVGTVCGASTIPSADALRPLASRTVYCWPDADDAGASHMQRVAERLLTLGCQDVRMIHWPDAPERGDAADYVARGGTAEGVRRLMAEAAAWDAGCADCQPESSPLRELDATELSALDIPSELPSLTFLGQDGYVIEGWSHLVAGYPKAGKTEVIYACVREWVRAGRSVLWITEESELVWAYRLRRDPGLPRGLRLVFGLGERPDLLLDRAMRGDEPVVVIDTIRSLLGIADEADNAEIARVVGQWESALRGKTRLYIHHLRKGLGEHGLAVAGGTMLVGSVDRVIELRHDEHDADRRVLRVISRIVGAPDLLLGLDSDGWPIVLGDPAAVELERVMAACLDVLEPDTWLKTSEVRERLPEPQPSHRQVLRALGALWQRGEVERDPADDRPRATYRWQLPSGLRPYIDVPCADQMHDGERQLSATGGVPVADSCASDGDLSAHEPFLYVRRTDQRRCPVCRQPYALRETDRDGWLQIRCRCHGGEWRWCRADDPALRGGV